LEPLKNFLKNVMMTIV